MSLTSRWIGDGEFILEVSDLSNTMGLSVTNIDEFYEALLPGRFPKDYHFDSHRHTCHSSRQADGWLYSTTRNNVRIDEEIVMWRTFYSLPHVGEVRKEVRWSRHELLRELRAAQVARRLRPKATGTYYTQGA